MRKNLKGLKQLPQGQGSIPQKYFITLFLIGLFFASCGRGGGGGTITTPTTLIKGYAFLENQAEHSGITVKLVENNLSTVTASDGSYTINISKDLQGTYTLNTIFPYYTEVSKTLDVTSGSSSITIENINLKQELQFSVDTDKDQYQSNETIKATLTVKNVSDHSVTAVDTAPSPLDIGIYSNDGVQICYVGGVLTSIETFVFSSGETKVFNGNIVDDRKTYNEIEAGCVKSTGKYFISASIGDEALRWPSWYAKKGNSQEISIEVK